MTLKIVVCGGGIGGLAVAAYLREHHDVTVLEKAPTYDVDDYGLSVVSNAYGLLLRLGVNEKALDSVRVTHVWSRNFRNEEIMTMDFASMGMVPSVLARRSLVQRELFRLATDPTLRGTPAKVINGAEITTVDIEKGSVKTLDGQSFEADLIIGSDGIGSRVRAAVLEEGSAWSSVVNHDLLAFMTRVPVEVVQRYPEFEYFSNPVKQAGIVSIAVEGADRTEELVFTGLAKKRVLIYATSPHELQVVGYAEEKEFGPEFEEKKTSILKDVPQQRVIDEFVSDFPPQVVDLFKQSTVDAWRIRDIDSLNTWWRGKAVLIGDAAHAVTPHAGQGCNITIEDAEALAYLLSDVQDPGKLSEVLQQYNQLRAGRSHLVQRFSRQLGNILSEEDSKKPPISQQQFQQMIFSYQGAKNAIAAGHSLDSATVSAEQIDQKRNIIKKGTVI